MGTGILKTGDKAIDFTLAEAGTGKSVTLSHLEGKKNVVVIFYRGVD